MKTVDALSLKRVGHGSATTGCRLVRRALALTVLSGVTGILVAGCTSLQKALPDSASIETLSSCPGPMAYQYPDCQPD